MKTKKKKHKEIRWFHFEFDRIAADCYGHLSEKDALDSHPEVRDDFRRVELREL